MLRLSDRRARITDSLLRSPAASAIVFQIGLHLRQCLVGTRGGGRVSLVRRPQRLGERDILKPSDG